MPRISWLRIFSEYSRSRTEDVFRLPKVALTKSICRLVSWMSLLALSISLSYCDMRVTTLCSDWRMRSSSASTSFNCAARLAYMVEEGSKVFICERSVLVAKLRSLMEACFRLDTVAVRRDASRSVLRVESFSKSICALACSSCVPSLRNSMVSAVAFI